MVRRVAGYNFVEPMILKVLENSRISLSTLAINYHVNAAAGKAVNLNVIKKNLLYLVAHKKVTEKLDMNGIAFYKQVA